MTERTPEIIRLHDTEHLGFTEIGLRLGIGRHTARRAYTKGMGGGAPAADGGPRSLVRFMRDKRREGCPICALDATVRQQLGEASTRKIPRAVQLEWLSREIGAKVSDTALSQHVAGRHDADAA